MELSPGEERSNEKGVAEVSGVDSRLFLLLLGVTEVLLSEEVDGEESNVEGSHVVGDE